VARTGIWSSHQGLRGSAGAVLTATGFVNGRGQFSTPPPGSTSLDRSPKNLLLVITSATAMAVPNLVQIRPRGGGLLAKWVKYNQIFTYLFIPFLGTHLQVSPVDGVSRLISQTTRSRAKTCLLGVSLTLPPIWG